MKPVFYILIIIVIIIFLLVLLRLNNLELITGFWRADEEFCKEADLELFWIYFAKSSFTGKNTGYVLMKSSSGEILINDSAEFDKKFVFGLKKISGSMKITWAEDADYSEFIPEELDMEIDLSSMSMRLTDGEVLYARLYKDGLLTEMGN